MQIFATINIFTKELILNKTSWIIFSVIIVGVLGALVLFSNEKTTDLNNIDANTIQTANDQNGGISDHVYGNADSKVVLIEYADYACSACALQHPKTEEVLEAYKDKIAFIFRNFPLTSIHANAKAAAATVEAAGLQNKYWEMHNLVYNNQSDWFSLSGDTRTNEFVSYAEQLDLDTDKFKSDMGSSAVSQKIAFDTAIAQKLGLNATPTFYLNGKKLDSDAWSTVDALEATLNDALNK